MTNRTIISDGINPYYRRFLHGDRKKPGENSFYGRPFLVKFFECFASIVDTFPDTGGQTNQNIASFLVKEFGVGSRTEEILLSLFSKVNGTAVLKIGNAGSFYGHFPFTV